MIPQSIRWRLPLSYAVIALLAALSLGGVLLSVLRDYYLQLEAEYLCSNLEAISDTIEQTMTQADMSPTVLQPQAETLSFLSEARVQIFDADGQVLADSGAFDASMFYIALDRQGPSRIILRAKGDEETPEDGPLFLFINKQIITSPITEADVITGTDYTLFAPDLPNVEPFPGFDLSAEWTLTSTRRSSYRERRPLHDAEGNLLGFVELSEGPPYGREILGSVARGWTIAGAISVILAAGVGWLISRRISAPLLALTNTTARMAEGDLAARANVASRNEVGLLARSFNQMADQVEDTIVTLRRFVSDAAHEIHTPLTALRTNLELASDDKFVRRAQAQVGRLEALTEGLLALSRIEAGEQAEGHTAVALTSLVQEVSELYASRAEQSGLTFDLALSGTPVTVRGDEPQLRRILDNLLDNSIKFTPQGGAVSVKLVREGKWAELSVEDTGIGIPEDDLPHLFGRFHRGRNAAAYPGSGLGLAIVKAIAESHDGQVAAENTAQGARFTLRLPMID
jgi:two-component system sensor histidine kinase BaeS